MQLLLAALRWTMAILLTWLVSSVLAGVVANSKGHQVGPWIGIGLLFGPFGLLAAVGLANEKQSKKYEVLIEQQQAMLTELQALNGR